MKIEQERIAELTRDLEKTTGATPETLAHMETYLGCVLPQQYKDFMLLKNGVSGFLSEKDASFLSLYTVEEVISCDEIFNEGIDVHSPLFVVASNGAGEDYAFDRSRPYLPIVNVPFEDWTDITPCGGTFLEFLEWRVTTKY